MVTAVEQRRRFNCSVCGVGVVLLIISILLALYIPDNYWRWLKLLGAGYFWSVITILLFECCYNIVDNFF
jgi:hypothetical protein